MAVMAYPVNLTGTTPSTASSYTSSPDTRPAAASNWGKVIYNTTTARHQVSTGTAWVNLPVVPYANPTSVPQYPIASAPLASANSGLVIRDGSTYYWSDGSTWITLGTDIFISLGTYVGVRTNKGLSQAVFLTRRTPTNTIYIDPVSGNNSNNGSTPALAKQSLPVLANSTAYLFKSGTTVPGFTVGVNGLNATTGSIVFGVYDAGTGVRYTGRVVGLVNVSGKVDIGGRSYISLENLNVTTTPGGDPLISADNSTACQVICCKVNGATVGIKQYLGGGQSGKIEIDGCEAKYNLTGIEITGSSEATTVNGSVIQYCDIQFNQIGIKWGGGARPWENCHIANNNIQRNYSDPRIDNERWTQVLIDGTLRNGSSIRWNTIKHGRYSNLWIQNNDNSNPNYGGLVIENNEFSYAQYCMNLFNIVSGASENNPILIQYNRMQWGGLLEPGVQANTLTDYGRCIELFSDGWVPEADWCKYVTIRWNDLSYATVWDEYGTEGIALGLDDRVRWITCYGNVIYGCEGIGGQFNNDKYNRIFGNVFIDNVNLPSYGLPNKPIENGTGAADIGQFGDGCLTFANAVVSGRDQVGAFSHYLAGDSNSYGHSNLYINPRVAAIMYASGTRGYNTHVRAPKIGVNNTGAGNYDADSSLPLATGDTSYVGSAIDDPVAYADAVSQALFDTLPFTGTVSTPPEPPPEGTGTVTIVAGVKGESLATTSLPVPVPAAVSGNTQLIAVIYRDKAVVATAPGGWSTLHTVPHDVAGGRLVVYYKVAGGTVAAGNVNVTFASNVLALGGGATITGTIAASVVGSTSEDWGDDFTMPSVTAAAANSMWLQLGASTDSPRTFGQSGATEVFEGHVDNGSNGVGLAFAWKEVPAGATGTELWTTVDPFGGANAERQLSISIAFTPQAGTTPPPAVSTGSKQHNLLSLPGEALMFLKQNEATAARRRIPLVCLDATDGVTPETGLTFAAADIKISKNGAAEANSAGTVYAKGGGASSGSTTERYYYEATQSELNTLGPLDIVVDKSGIRKQYLTVQVVPMDVYDPAGLGLTNLAVPTLTASQMAAGILDEANTVETGMTLRGWFRVAGAALMGKLTGAGTGTEIFRNAVADSKSRITATVDTSGNRTSITTDQT